MLLDDALRYHQLNWSIIPIRRNTKKAACKWKKYQETQPDRERLENWFGQGKYTSLAVILGEVSGGLVCRDFDDMGAFKHWAAEHPDLSQKLPTVETGRPGRHVYATAEIEQIRAVSPSKGSIVDLGDGELRGGGYCLLPPSKHPEGTAYCWLIPLPDELPFIPDLQAAGFLDSFSATESTRDNRDNGEQQRSTEVIELIERVSPNWLDLGGCEDAKRAIIESLPTGPGKRNQQVFKLARALKAIPPLQDAHGKDLEPFVRLWHEQAKPVIRTQPFEETFIDFLRAWPKVKFPKGAEPMSQIFAAAVNAEVPPVAMRYEQEQLRLLVALCRELQRAAGEGPFYLACRTAGRLLGVDHTTAWRWLFLLQEEGILKVMSKGSQATGKANRYRYVPGL